MRKVDPWSSTGDEEAQSGSGMLCMEFGMPNAPESTITSVFEPIQRARDAPKDDGRS
jgi:hypothetical protein